MSRIELAIATDFFSFQPKVDYSSSSIKWIFPQGLSVCKTPNRWPADDIRFFFFFSYKMQWTLYISILGRLLMDKSGREFFFANSLPLSSSSIPIYFHSSTALFNFSTCFFHFNLSILNNFCASLPVDKP